MSSTDKTIPQLDPAGTLTGTEVVHVVKNGESVYVPLSALAAYIKVAETIVPSTAPFRGVLLERTSDLTGVSFPAIVPWQQTVYDTDSFWSGGASTRITIPAGITKVRLVGAVSATDAAQAGSITCRVQKNGAEYKFSVNNIRRDGTIGFVDNLTWTWTPVVPVVQNDYFELRVNKSGMASVVNIQSPFNTFFGLEVIELA